MAVEAKASPSDVPTMALVLGGGGARGAYQVGVLKGIADFVAADFPFRVVTGVSAGAINAAMVASASGTFWHATRALEAAWLDLNSDRVFKTSVGSMSWSFFRWLWMLTTGMVALNTRGLFDTSPLHQYLATHIPVHNIDTNIDTGRLRALALSTTSYQTGQTATFVHGDPEIPVWERAHRYSIQTKMTVSHVMASAALPLLFPAIQLGNGYYGDGSIRHTSPLAPAIHLGAHRLLTISLRYAHEGEEPSQPGRAAYPPPAQILSLMMHGVFLDSLEYDAERLQRINRTLKHVPSGSQTGDQLRTIDLLILRPSQNLGKLAHSHAPHLPYTLRTMARGLGSSETGSPDFLSYLMFDKSYIQQLIELGYEDATARVNEIQSFLAGG